MLTCKAAEIVILREADGTLGPADRDALLAHVAACASCARKRAAQEPVRSTLARRPAAAPPEGFLESVLQQLPREEYGWLPPLDWRRWTAWSLPVAASLMLIVAVAGQPGTQQAAPAESAGVIELWAEGGEPEASPAAAALREDASTEEMLAALLSVSAPASGETR